MRLLAAESIGGGTVVALHGTYFPVAGWQDGATPCPPRGTLCGSYLVGKIAVIVFRGIMQPDGAVATGANRAPAAQVVGARVGVL